MALTKAACQTLGWNFEIDNGQDCSAQWVPTDGTSIKGPIFRGQTVAANAASATVLAKITEWDRIRNRFVSGHLKVK